MDKKILSDYIDACAVIRETEEEIRKLEKKKKVVQDKVTGSNPEWPYEPRSFSLGGTKPYKPLFFSHKPIELQSYCFSSTF